MMAAVSPADYNYDETLSTLRYANRAKNIKNKPKINEDPKDAMLREYKAQIDQLKAILEAQAAGQPLDGRWAGEGMEQPGHRGGSEHRRGARRDQGRPRADLCRPSRRSTRHTGCFPHRCRSKEW